MEVKYILKFSKNDTYVAHKDGVLYINTDITRAYSPVSKVQYLQILRDGTVDSAALNSVLSYITPTIIRKPSNLKWTPLYQRSIYMYEVNSSNVNAVGYDEQNNILYVTYIGGDTYSYDNVPIEYWNGLKSADSKGSYLHWFIKINSNEFTYRKVNNANLTPTSSQLDNPGTAHPNGYMTNF